MRPQNEAAEASSHQIDKSLAHGLADTNGLSRFLGLAGTIEVAQHRLHVYDVAEYLIRLRRKLVSGVFTECGHAFAQDFQVFAGRFFGGHS